MKPLLLLLALSLSACSSLEKSLANRVSCTADGQRAMVSSMWGPVGVASVVDAGDAAAICRRLAQ